MATPLQGPPAPTDTPTMSTTLRRAGALSLLAFAGTAGLAGTAYADYAPSHPVCGVSPGTTSPGQPVTVSITTANPGPVVVTGSGPVIIPNPNVEVGDNGATTSVKAGSTSGTAVITIHKGGSTTTCSFTVVAPASTVGAGAATRTPAAVVTHAPTVVNNVTAVRNAVPAPATLPYTGAPAHTGALVGAGAGAIALGGGLVLATRRRRTV